MSKNEMLQRASGVLLHISALPSSFGVGDFGPGAYRFVDFLKDAGQSVWQILPLNPTDSINGNSPYSSHSAFAGNNLFISPELLVKEKLLLPEDISGHPHFAKERVEYQKAAEYKETLLRKAFLIFQKEESWQKQFKEFSDVNGFWLDDYALFLILKEKFRGQVWNQWPYEILKRDSKALEQIRQEHSQQIAYVEFCQFLFFYQWHQLRDYCAQKGISIIGDVPIYVSFDSADVWTHPEIFKLDEKLQPYVVAGVPPDYFSKTGQRWGNPVYNWEALQASNFQWWLKRMENNFKLFDIVRLDHFRGLVQFWEIPASERTAVNGHWQSVPTDAFFDAIKSEFPSLPIIAEDLGYITDDVKEVMNRYGFPGMKILLFAFNGEQDHPYLPHIYKNNCVVFTGTHDNNTVQGWYQREATPKEKENFKNYLAKHAVHKNSGLERDIHWAFIRLAMQSAAGLAIIPMQDILGLGQKSRFNTPATVEGNWQWRLFPESLSKLLARKILKITQSTSRI